MITIKCKDEFIFNGVLELLSIYEEVYQYSEENLEITIDASEEYIFYEGMCFRSCWDVTEVWKLSL
ncbi:MAG: hypothetical protein LBV74_01160 [Tannerella sp.]|jgi:hypothetical protein|nr:hypothetical protein [Tannerella sp.]